MTQALSDDIAQQLSEGKDVAHNVAGSEARAATSEDTTE